MIAWGRGRRRIDDLERDVAGLRQALAAADARIDALLAAQSAAADAVRDGDDRLREELERRLSALADRLPPLGDRLDEFDRRMDDAGRDATAHRDEAERRGDERFADVRRAAEETNGAIAELRIEQRRHDVRLRAHIEDTDALAAALLDRAGRARLGEGAS